MIFNNRVYDILKWVAIVFLDAVGVCYRALAAIWAWPLGDEVLATCSALSVFLGALLGISNAQYERQQADVHRDACDELARQNKELRDELATNIESTFESFPEDDM